jgi:hypothetical protein
MDEIIIDKGIKRTTNKAGILIPKAQSNKKEFTTLESTIKVETK